MRASRYAYADNPPRRASVERVLRKLGWTSANPRHPHAVWFSPDRQRTTCVSGHKGRDVPYGTFRAVLKDIGITEKQFNKLA